MAKHGHESLGTDYEVVSELTTPATMRALLGKLSELLGDVGSPITAEFGIGCNMRVPEMFKPQLLEQPDLQQFVSTAEEQGLVALGSGDLIFKTTDRSVMLILCHDADIHLVASSPDWLNRFSRLLREQGLRAYRRVYSVHRTEWEEV